MDGGSRDRLVGARADHRGVAVRALPQPDGEHVRGSPAGDDAQSVRRPCGCERREGGSGSQVSPTTVAQPNPLAEGLHDYRLADPSMLVIFGATGDLSSKKLLPAIYNLAKQRLLPAGFAVVGAAIDDLSDDAYRKRASEKISTFSRTQPVDPQVLQSFLDAVFYVKVDFSKLDDFKTLARKLDELDHARHV